MRVALDPDSRVSALIVGGQKVRHGEPFEVSKKDYKRLADLGLVVVVEGGGGEPSDGEEESQEDN